MKSLILYLLVIIAILAVSRCAEAACYATPQAVWQEHPQTHAAWHIVDGKKCWHVMTPLRRASRGRRFADGTASAPPLPRPRPELELLYPEIYPRILPVYGRALSRQLFGE